MSEDWEDWQPSQGNQEPLAARTRFSVVKTYFRSPDQSYQPSGLETKTETLVFRSRDQDQDLGHQVSRSRPSQNELECTQVSRPWSRSHITGCINSNWWQSTRLKVLQIIYGNRATGEAPSMLSWDQDRDLGLQVSRPRLRPGPSGLETETETWVFRSRDQGRDLGHQVWRPRPRSGSSGLETKTETWVFSSRDQDRDLGYQVSRPRPKQNELECTRVSRPWSRDHNTDKVGDPYRSLGILLKIKVTFFWDTTYFYVCPLWKTIETIVSVLSIGPFTLLSKFLFNAGT